MQAVSMKSVAMGARWQPGAGMVMRGAQTPAGWAPPPMRMSSPVRIPPRRLAQAEGTPALGASILDLAFNGAAMLTGLVFWARMPAKTVADVFIYAAAGTALIFGVKTVGNLIDLTRAK